MEVLMTYSRYYGSLGFFSDACIMSLPIFAKLVEVLEGCLSLYLTGTDY